jgi:hypothetical protein
VCTGPIRGIPVDVGHGLKQVSVAFRHRRCEPGGARWMEIQAAKPKKERSELYEYYLEENSEKA